MNAGPQQTGELSTNLPVPRPRVWTVFAMVPAALVLTVILQGLAAIAIVLSQADEDHSAREVALRLQRRLAEPWLFMVLAAAGQIAIGALTLLAAWKSPLPMRESLGWNRPAQGPLIYPLVIVGSWLPLAIGLALAHTISSLLSGTPSIDRLYANLTPEMAVPFVLFIALAPGFTEELMFRGYIQRRLLQRWGPVAAIMTASLLFAVIHVSPVAIGLALPLGLWFGLVAWRTGSVWPTIAGHAFVNGSLNIWRICVVFFDVTPATQFAVEGAAVAVGALFLVWAIRVLMRAPVISSVPATPSARCP